MNECARLAVMLSNTISMELNFLSRLALLYWLLNQQILSAANLLNEPSDLCALTSKQINVSLSPLSASRYTNNKLEDEYEPYYRLRSEFLADRRKSGPPQVFNWQTTTTLQRFNTTGSVDDDLEPRIDRYTSVQWLAEESGFNPNLRTVFVLHGYFSLSLAQQRWANGIRNLIYRWKDSANMFYVDWNHKSNILYPIYRGALHGAMEVAEDLRIIIANFKLAFPQWDSSNIHLIAHSLGSHVSGRLGYLMGSNSVKQISAMDPPDTFQKNEPAEKKLTSGDADFVIAYVTDGSYFGTRYRQADVNLLINGGFQQPGCVKSIGFLCNHMRAAYYNSVNMGKCIMVGYRADSYEQFSRGLVGYCGEDSDACIGAGNWWQYDEGLQMSEKHFRPGSDWRSKRQGENSSVTGWHPFDHREYYLRVSDEEPWCKFLWPRPQKWSKINQRFLNRFLAEPAFTYQVALGFEHIGSAEMVELQSIDKLYISLEQENSTAGNGISVKLVKFSPRIHESKQRVSFGPGVFESALSAAAAAAGGRSGKGRKMRRGKQAGTTNSVVYTGLALIEAKHPMYNLMPTKFSQAIVWLPGSSSPEARWLEPGEQPQVYVNFMSDNRFERRQHYSGPVSRVYWAPPYSTAPAPAPARA